MINEKHAKWLYSSINYIDGIKRFYKCSECNYEQDKPTRICPHCNARMDIDVVRREEEILSKNIESINVKELIQAIRKADDEFQLESWSLTEIFDAIASVVH